jgi:8-oxo-dGTP diphosphatase
VSSAERAQAIVVSAVVLRDGAGRLLTVRKRGTGRFMLPGGKPEPAESPQEAAVRECREELGLELDIDALRLLGRWRAAAANESGRTVEATVYEHPGLAVGEPSAELEELRWLDLEAAAPDDLAPLLTQWVLPAISADPPRRSRPQRAGRRGCAGDEDGSGAPPPARWPSWS